MASCCTRCSRTRERSGGKGRAWGQGRLASRRREASLPCPQARPLPPERSRVREQRVQHEAMSPETYNADPSRQTREPAENSNARQDDAENPADAVQPKDEDPREHL